LVPGWRITSHNQTKFIPHFKYWKSFHIPPSFSEMVLHPIQIHPYIQCVYIFGWGGWGYTYRVYAVQQLSVQLVLSLWCILNPKCCYFILWVLINDLTCIFSKQNSFTPHKNISWKFPSPFPPNNRLKFHTPVKILLPGTHHYKWPLPKLQWKHCISKYAANKLKWWKLLRKSDPRNIWNLVINNKNTLHSIPKSRLF